MNIQKNNIKKTLLIIVYLYNIVWLASCQILIKQNKDISIGTPIAYLKKGDILISSYQKDSTTQIVSKSVWKFHKGISKNIILKQEIYFSNNSSKKSDVSQKIIVPIIDSNYFSIEGYTYIIYGLSTYKISCSPIKN